MQEQLEENGGASAAELSQLCSQTQRECDYLILLFAALAASCIRLNNLADTFPRGGLHDQNCFTYASHLKAD